MDRLRQLHRDKNQDGHWWTFLREAESEVVPELLGWLQAGKLELDDGALKNNGVTRDDLATLFRVGRVRESGHGGLIEGRRLPALGTYLQIVGTVPVHGTVLRKLECRLVVPRDGAGDRALAEAFWR